MPDRDPPIARIRLARAPVRLLFVPLALVAVAAGLTAAAVLGPMRALEAAWIAMVAGGAVLLLGALVIAIWLFGLRLDVEEAAVRVHWLGGQRLHPLVPGPVTRVRLRGQDASSLRSWTGRLGWTVGRATLRREERIQVIRLAATPTAILVPTEGGRLAIAAASESELIEALSRAARARQRIEEVTRPMPQAAEPAPTARAASSPEPLAELEPHALTGIERAELEGLLGRDPGMEVARALAASAAPPAVADGAVVAPAPTASTAQTAAEATPDRGRWGRTTVRIGGPRPSVALVLLPLLGAGGVWAAATVGGRLPEPGTDIGRLTSLALVLAGPATSVGAIMARAWWPRLVGVVVTSGLAAAVFVGRALLGP